MRAYNYRSEAIRHTWEFLTLGYDRPDAQKQLFNAARTDPEHLGRYIADARSIILDLVRATPSKRGH